MKKFATIALAVVLSMGILTGCGSSKKAAEATTEVKEETVDYGQGLNENGTLPFTILLVCSRSTI